MTNELVVKWQNISINDLIYKKDLKSLNKKQILTRFENPLNFGTAGIRGIMGFGPSRINELTISAASLAYAKYLLKYQPDSKKYGIIIGHDNRHNGKFFAEVAFRTLKAQGIKAYLYQFNELQPTPLISYTIRKLKLSGAIIITASHNPKEYNGFKVYNSLGGQLLPNQTKKVQEFLTKIDPLTIEKYSGPLAYISNKVIDDYIKEVLKVQLRPNDQKVLKVVFSPQHGTSAKIGPQLLSMMKIKHFNVKKQMAPDPDFKHTKNPNPEDGKSFKKAIWLARRKKADLAIVTDPDADRLGIVTKYKHRYKFLNGNELAALYLDYLITNLKQTQKLPEKAFIVKTVVSGNLAEKIALKNGITVYETHVGFKNIAQIIEEKQQAGEKFLFAYEESFGFLLNPKICRDKDALQAMVGVVEMTNYYKTQNISLYSKLESLWQQYGVHRSTVISKTISQTIQNKLLQRISKTKRVGEQKVIQIEDYRKGYNNLDAQNLIKVILKNGSWFAIRPSGTEPKVKVYIQTMGKNDDALIDVVMLERVIFNLIEDQTEVEDNPKISVKGILKYSSFLIIIGILLTIVFLFVYKGFKGQSVLEIAGQIFNSQTRIIWFGVIVWTFFTILLEAWIKKRLLKLQKEKVALHYLIISAFMGQIISFITPLSIGGDAIVYWYLRKKGVKRAPLLSTLVSALILYQARIVIQTLILLPVGFPMYQEFLANGSPEAKASLILFIIGLVWNSFATLMIFLLALNRTFQEWILVKSITFLEWMPFVSVYDPGSSYARVQYEFNEMRIGMKSLWKTWWVIFEMLFYFLLPVFFNPLAIVLAAGGFVNNNLQRGPYWSQIVANDIISTSNSLSFTPGGSGTLEWLTISVNQRLYNNSEFQISTGISAESIASGIDLNWKIINDWPKLIFSSLLIGNIIVGEWRVYKYQIINKNLHLTGKKPGRSTRVYYFTAIPWIIILLTWIILIFVFPVNSFIHN